VLKKFLYASSAILFSTNLIAAPLDTTTLIAELMQVSCSGVSGVSIPNLADKATWSIWRAGPKIQALSDSCEATLLASGTITSALSVPLVSDGISITSTGNPAINGTYSIDSDAQANISSVVLYTLVNSKFPGGTSTYVWADKNGVLHSGFTVAQFQAFGTAVADYVAGIVTGEFSLLNGMPTTWPSSSATIP